MVDRSEKRRNGNVKNMVYSDKGYEDVERHDRQTCEMLLLVKEGTCLIFL